MPYFTDIKYDEFFPVVEDTLRGRLPPGLEAFKWRRPGNNYIRLRYLSLKNSYYELQFSDYSEHHPEYFEKGPHIILAFYYEASFDKRIVWLDALNPYVDYICEQLGTTVKSGQWGKNWACLITNLDNETRSTEHFSRLIAYFIQATYIPINLAFKAMGQ